MKSTCRKPTDAGGHSLYLCPYRVGVSLACATPLIFPAFHWLSTAFQALQRVHIFPNVKNPVFLHFSLPR